MIVTPNKVEYKGIKVMGEETTDEKADALVALENVVFSYPSKPLVEVLRDVSLDVKQNQIVALVGSSGKSCSN